MPDVDHPSLAKPPIVEAVIDFRTLPEIPWDENKVKAYGLDNLKGYTYTHSQQETEMQFNPGSVTSVTVNQKFKGIRFDSDDKKNCAQFNQNGFVFSRLAPYQNWEVFSKEALHLWSIYQGLRTPAPLQRLATRFINRIFLDSGTTLADVGISENVLESREVQLKRVSFTLQETCSIPGSRFAINIIRVSQEPPVQKRAIILDLDVFTTSFDQMSLTDIELVLEEMRQIKNQVFFSIISQRLKDHFKI